MKLCELLLSGALLVNSQDKIMPASQYIQQNTSNKTYFGFIHNQHPPYQKNTSKKPCYNTIYSFDLETGEPRETKISPEVSKRVKDSFLEVQKSIKQYRSP